MDWEKLADHLKQIFAAPVLVVSIPPADWKKAAAQESATTAGQGVWLANAWHFMLEAPGNGQPVIALAFSEAELGLKEQALISLAIEAARPGDKQRASTPAVEEERKAYLIRDWFTRQLEQGIASAELSEPLASQLSFHKARIPFLLSGEFSGASQVSYRELKKLLESFFDSEVHLIPLVDKEWLIFAPETLLSESYGEDETEETVEDVLAALAEGLYEMLSNEWLGECHLSVHYPVTPAKSLLSAALALRETVLLGKAFHVGSNIHLPWQLQMEKLMYAIPEAEKNVFINQVFKRNDPVLEGETLSTLESFFHLECNVSETAKKLYIHRNTLLYRLDKFKQETGYDVRSFNDAVLVRIAVLLYKFTKRQ